VAAARETRPSSARWTAARDSTCWLGIGGAITKLAGVELGLERYDPERVRGFVLESGEVDRQIELYRMPRFNGS
jgi:exopolyphosphatase/pppGpp-phosphohydrolase